MKIYKKLHGGRYPFLRRRLFTIKLIQQWKYNGNNSTTSGKTMSYYFVFFILNMYFISHAHLYTEQ